MRNVTGSVLLVAVLCAGTTNCASEISTEVPGALGQASVPLTAMGASGALYRLTGATFTVAGPTSSNDLDRCSAGFGDDRRRAQCRRLSDHAAARLGPGADAPRHDPGGGSGAGFGQSDELRDFSDQVVTPVSFVFQVDGDVIPMGQGVLRLGIAVEETGPCMSDAECAPDEFCNLTTGECVPAECDADADCGAGNWCFTSLSFGNFCVATGSGGLGVPCDGNNIFSCEAHLACIQIGAGPPATRSAPWPRRCAARARCARRSRRRTATRPTSALASCREVRERSRLR